MGQVNYYYRHCTGYRKVDKKSEKKKPYKLTPIDIEFINEEYVKSPIELKLNFI